jgi:acyl carrier protein
MNDIFKVHREIEEIINLQNGTLSGDENLTEIDWDSMASVMFIALADEKYSKEISLSNLETAQTVSDLVNLLIAN